MTSIASQASKWPSQDTILGLVWLQIQKCIASCLYLFPLFPLFIPEEQIPFIYSLPNSLYLFLKSKMTSSGNQMIREHKVSYKNILVKSFGLGAGCKKTKGWHLDGAKKTKKNQNMLREVAEMRLRHLRTCLRNGWTLGFLPIAESRILKSQVYPELKAQVKTRVMRLDQILNTPLNSLLAILIGSWESFILSEGVVDCCFAPMNYTSTLI